ncbi:MAG TPA: hypothetical protein VJR90_01825 [Gammaproteobacteria bacterium]|nr:hypothetical protein [Gammaproteobacteria bacterium]
MRAFMKRIIDTPPTWPLRPPFGLYAQRETMVRLWTDRYQPVPLSIAGPGAGPEPTAAGVLTDILKAARELLHSR